LSLRLDFSEYFPYYHDFSGFAEKFEKDAMKTFSMRKQSFPHPRRFVILRFEKYEMYFAECASSASVASDDFQEIRSFLRRISIL
jgi:hypothetical protein